MDAEANKPGSRQEQSKPKRKLTKREHASERHHAENAARREVGNSIRLAVLRNYRDALTAVLDLCMTVHKPAGDGNEGPERPPATSSGQGSRGPASMATAAPGPRRRKRDMAAARDADLLSDGLSGDGEPLRAEVERELELVIESLRLAEVGNFTPRSADGLRETTAAIMVERGVSDYAATIAVYKVGSAAVAESKERQRVKRAAKRRRAARPK
ncbi:MAG TPA: hypothetical protein VH165_01355 [Kofleriaceae bacterium]|nr:hypothetical protein [Kofleriaceae bacterium]